jgi:hypothetical protein
MLDGEFNFKHRISLPEDLGQRPLRVVRGEGVPIDASLAGEFLDLVEADGLVEFGVNQKAVFSQETGEEQSVPVLVGDLVDEAVDGLRAGGRIATISELSSASPQPTAEHLVSLAHA